MQQEVEDFLAKLRDGSGLANGSAAYKTLTYLLAVSGSQLKTSFGDARWCLFQKMLYGFNLHLLGEKVERFPQRNIDTPPIEGAEPDVIIGRFFPDGIITKGASA